MRKKLALTTSLFALCNAITAADPIALLAPLQAWKYNDESIDLGTNWISRDNDDSSWSNGLTTKLPAATAEPDRRANELAVAGIYEWLALQIQRITGTNV